MEALIAIGILAILGFLAFRHGKQIGSRKGFGVGRFRRR